MATNEAKVQLLNVNEGVGNTRNSREKYAAMRRAILKAVPGDERGIAFRDLPRKVAGLVPREVFLGRSISWYTTTVKLDLEARRLIERVPGSRPQRLRRVRSEAGDD
ncbi:MAG: hypothetical protein ACE5JG_11395 [Planctomycetota bacterium]